jgi:hypothetical protein
MYEKIPADGQHEVIGMSGDIALYQESRWPIVGNPDGTTRAGHVLDAYVSPTLEVIVTVDPIEIQKRFDPQTDLTLIDPASVRDQAQFEHSRNRCNSCGLERHEYQYSTIRVKRHAAMPRTGGLWSTQI